MTNKKAIVVFTQKSARSIIDKGGSGDWRLDPSNALACTYVVCTRNLRPLRDAAEDPYTAFLIGKVKDIVPKVGPPENGEAPENRYCILFSEYARINVPDAWTKGVRNPVRYESIDRLGIDPTTLAWEKTPDFPKVSVEKSPSLEGNYRSKGRLTIMEAKQALALNYGISPDAVEITIRG